VSEGKPFDLALGRPYRIDVWADPAREVDVAVDGRPRYADFAAPPPALGDTDIGENPYSGDIEDTVPGTVIALDIPMPTCEALTDN